jgi:ABC-type glycerol-3-phosphate transport system substrate-binding protein
MTGALVTGLLAGCASDDPADEPAGQTDDGSTEPEEVSISVVSLIPGSEQAAFDAFDERVAQFEAEYPYIDVEGVEYEWRATTFAAQLAGGTLPDVYEIPLTDAKTLIENGQLADLDAQFAQLDYADEFNETLLASGKGEDGHVYAIPAKSIYGVALHYNRDLFTQAGLDPDSRRRRGTRSPSTRRRSTRRRVSRASRPWPPTTRVAGR